MLYLLHGTDRKKIADHGHKLVSALSNKRPDAEVFRLQDRESVVARLEELIGSTGLFESKYIVVLDFVLNESVVLESVLSFAKEMSESDHIFLILEEKLDAATKKKLEKHATKTDNFDEKVVKKDSFNIFSITDSFLKKDKKGTWVILQRALREGIAPEEIHGILWWQTKVLNQVLRDDTEGLKPFVISKTKRALGNFSAQDVEKISSDLVTSYHDARRGERTLENSLEKLILSM